MKFLAILPVVLCMVALILTFLALFAGSKPGYMEDYAIITLNTSRFGENAINLLSNNNNNDNGDTNIFQQIFDNITSATQQDLNDDINDVAQYFGLHDWYSLHVLDFCQGQYEPAALPNATLSGNQIWKNVTNCSSRTALLEWDPKAELQSDLDSHGLSWLNISQLHWPDTISTAIDDLHTDFKATFVFYCIAVGLIFLAFFAAVASVFLLGRVFSFVNVALDGLAFLVVGIASALVTATMTQGTDRINRYGSDAGIGAYGSSKLLAITWSATALMFVASCVWCLDCIIGRRDPSRKSQIWRKRQNAKHDDVDMSNVN